MKVQLVAKTLEAHAEIIEEIIKQSGNHTIILFDGPMGSGKTTLIKSLCKFLKVTDQVNSPTYGFVNEYHTFEKRKIYHFDFYRINDINEAFDMGVEEYFYSGNLCLLEWAEKIHELLPQHYLKVSIQYHSDKRDYIIEEI